MLRALRPLILLAVLANLVGASLALAQEADLLVTKSGPAQANAGTDVTYTVTITNLGPDAATTVALADPLPPGMTFVSESHDPAFSCVPPAVGFGGTITCTAPTLAASASANFTFVFHIPPATPPGTTFVNIATAGSATFDPTSENDSGIAATSTPPPPFADMQVTKTGPTAAAPNTDVVYTIVVTNAGPDPASSVTLSDPLPVGVPPSTMTFVSLTQTGVPMTCVTPTVGSGGTVTCTAASYPANGTTTLTLTGHIPTTATSGTTFTNIANVSASTADPVPENNSAPTTLTVSTVDVSTAKLGPLTVTAGDPVSYALQIRNNGPDPAVNVTLSDTLPPNTTFVSFVQDNGPLATSCSTPAPGGTGTVTCNFAVLGSALPADFTLVIRAGDTTSITNTVTGTTDSFDTDHTNDAASFTTTVDPRANVGVTKTGPATATAGANVTYTITVTNAGASTAVSVSLTDTLPPNTTFVSLNQTAGPTFTCTTPGVGSPGTITCTIASLAPNVPATFSLVVRLAPSVSAGGSVANTANVSTTTVDPDPSDNTFTTSATTAVSADVGVVKSGSDSVGAGSTATYTIVVSNAGPSNASTVSLTDTVPAGTTFASLNQTTGPSFACTTPVAGGTGTITCTIATLASGASATFNLVLNVLPSTTGTLDNTATVSATTPDPTSANNSSTKTATVGVSADLSVTKTGPASALAETTVTYTLTVANNGPASATSVSLSDTLPPNTTFASLTQTTGPAFSCSTPAAGGTGTITCTIATFASGASATFSLVLNVAPSAIGTLSNTATVSAATADPNAANNSSTAATSVSGADVSVTKTGPATAPVGTNVTYTVTVSNAGPANAASVSLTDTVPAGTTFVSATQTTGPTFTCSTPAPGAAGTLTCTIATFASGASATFSIVVNVSPGTTGTLTNTATVSASTSDPTPGNNSASTTAAVSPLADLGIAKTASEPAAASVTFTIVVTNNGPAAGQNVVVTDVLPVGTTFTSVATTQGSCASGPTVTCALGTLPVGGSVTITLVVAILSNTAVSNTATVAASSPDPNPANNSSTAAVGAAAIPTLSAPAFALLALVLIAAGFWVLRRRRPASTR